MKRLTLLATTLLLTACTAIPVKTLYKLATTDPMSVDPKIIRAAARMPDWIEPRPNGAKLTITAQLEGAEPSKETFILQSIPLALAEKELSQAVKQGFKLYTYRINPEDMPRLEAFRNKAKARKAAGAKLHGNMAISVDACHKGAIKEGAILLSNYLRLNEDEGYLPVLVDYDLRKSVDDKGLAESLPTC